MHQNERGYHQVEGEANWGKPLRHFYSQVVREVEQVPKAVGGITDRDPARRYQKAGECGSKNSGKHGGFYACGTAAPPFGERCSGIGGGGGSQEHSKEVEHRPARKGKERHPDQEAGYESDGQILEGSHVMRDFNLRVLPFRKRA